MITPPDLPTSLSESIPWDSKEGAIWIASTLTLRRNLSRFSFPSKLGEGDIPQVIEQLEKAIREALPETHFYPDKEISTLGRQLIFEHFLMMHGFKQPPNGGAIGIDEKSQLLTLLNLGNHLEFRSITPGNHLDDAWAILNQGETQVGKELGFAFSPKFGYLTADPAECGTGMTASAYLHLPALVHTEQLEGALKNVEDPDVDFFGLTGDVDDLTGDILVVENRYTIGLSEENILHAIQSAAGKLLSAETVIRDHLRQESNAHIKDLVSKGYGLLVHSHQLEIKEALDLLSLMKLGLSIGLITGVSDSTLSRLYFNCRKGHLARSFPNIKEAEEIEQKRADFLQKELEGMQVND